MATIIEICQLHFRKYQLGVNSKELTFQIGKALIHHKSDMLKLMEQDLELSGLWVWTLL